MLQRRLQSIGRFLLVFLGVLAVLTEEFLWAWTGRLMALLGRWAPVARLESAIARLSPYPAIALFIFPWAIILPVKLIALYWVAEGQLVSGALLFIVGEVLGIAILARLYEICRPALLQLSWFGTVERCVIGSSRWAHQLLDTLAVYRKARQLVTAHVRVNGHRVQRLWMVSRRISRMAPRRRPL